MPPKVVDGKDLKRGENFEKICEALFPGKSNDAIGEALGGYPEGTIRNWKKGGSIGNTATYEMAKLGVSMEFLFRGEGEIFSLPNDTSATLKQKPQANQAEGEDITYKFYAAIGRLASHSSAVSDPRNRQYVEDVIAELEEFSDGLDLPPDSFDTSQDEDSYRNHNGA